MNLLPCTRIHSVLCLIISIFLFMSFAVQATPPQKTENSKSKMITMEMMNQFNMKVQAKLSALDKTKKVELAQKLKAINATVLTSLQDMKALKPILIETVKILKKEQIDTSKLETVLKTKDQTKINAQFNLEMVETLKKLTKPKQMELLGKFHKLNQKVIEDPKVNPKIRAAMNQVVQLLKSNQITTSDLEKMY